MCAGFWFSATIYPEVCQRQCCSSQDYSGAAFNFFNNLRVPSLLLMGAACAGLFAPPSIDGRWKNAARYARRIYSVCMALTVSHCLMVVFLTTITTTSILLGEIDTMAASAHDLLMGTLFFEVSSCRAFFLTSLTTFLAALASKTFATIACSETSGKTYTCLGIGISAFLLWAVFAQQAYINSHISASFGNLGYLYARVVWMWLTKFHPLAGFAGALQWVSYIFSVSFMSLGVFLSWQRKAGKF